MEPQNRIGTALFVATLLALGAIAVAEAFGFAFFEPSPDEIVQESAAQHPHIFAAMAKCLTEPTVITVAGVPAADCKPRGKR